MNTDSGQQDSAQERFDNINQPVEGEERSRTRAAEEQPVDGDGVYLTSDSKLQSPQEFEMDKNRQHTDDEVSPTVTHDDKGDAMGGSDRAGTFEREPGESSINRDPESARERDDKVGNL
jgi:hypothetical protein